MTARAPPFGRGSGILPAAGGAGHSLIVRPPCTSRHNIRRESFPAHCKYNPRRGVLLVEQGEGTTGNCELRIAKCKLEEKPLSSICNLHFAIRNVLSLSPCSHAPFTKRLIPQMSRRRRADASFCRRIRLLAAANTFDPVGQVQQL